MSFFGAFQWSAFQWSAFQLNAEGEFSTVTGHGGKFTYVPAYQKTKTEIKKLDSVLAEVRRKETVVAKSISEAERKKALKRIAELEALRGEYIEEINRLLAVRAELMQRMRGEEEMLFVAIAAKRKRLGAGNGQANFMLAFI